MTHALCIIQMRLHSSRLANKMLLKLGDETLAARAWRLATETFGRDDVVVAIPASDEAGPLGDELRRIGAKVFAWAGDERDVLGRYHACAHYYRWQPSSIIFRWTGDDPFKIPAACRTVLAGHRLPVELGGEAFTLAMLDAAHERELPAHRGTDFGQSVRREHLTHSLFPIAPPPAPPGIWTVDTPEQYAAACARHEAEERERARIEEEEYE